MGAVERISGGQQKKMHGFLSELINSQHELEMRRLLIFSGPAALGVEESRVAASVNGAPEKHTFTWTDFAQMHFLLMEKKRLREIPAGDYLSLRCLCPVKLKYPCFRSTLHDMHLNSTL